uniref:Uncharacterized protein n=1 Tax=Arcella intermedia TaxID=1963864 RepID=A0A6B2LC51_9EUKA
MTEAMKADPFSPEIRCFLGYAQRLAGNTIEARRHFQKAINMKADFSDAHQGLGIIAMGEKDYYTARIHFFDALQCEPKNVSVMLHVAQSHLAENQLERAKGYFEKALQLDPKNVTVCASLGETYARMSDMRGARDYLQKATELDPNYGGALCSYCAVLVELNEFETALGCIKRVVEIMADPVKSKEQRGVPLQNRVKGLEEMWSSKLKYFWDSKNMRAAEEVANLISQISDIKEINMFSVTNKIKSHQLDDAESLLRRILKKDPNDKNAALMLAGVLKMKSEEGIKRY